MPLQGSYAERTPPSWAQLGPYAIAGYLSRGYPGTRCTVVSPTHAPKDSITLLHSAVCEHPGRSLRHATCLPRAQGSDCLAPCTCDRCPGAGIVGHAAESCQCANPPPSPFPPPPTHNLLLIQSHRRTRTVTALYLHAAPPSACDTMRGGRRAWCTGAHASERAPVRLLHRASNPHVLGA